MCPENNSSKDSYWLSNITYNEKKAIIVADFSNAETRRSIPFSFFPSAIVNHSGLDEETFRELAYACSDKRFRLESKGNGISILTARSYSELSSMMLSIKASAEISYLLLSPERQFLLSKRWSFFDKFSIEGQNIVKVASYSLPEATIGPSPKTVAEQASELLFEDEALGNEFLSRVALSRVLSIRPEKVPSTEMQQSEILLENIFFRNSFVPSYCRQEAASSLNKCTLPFYDAEAIDFSWVWFGLLADENQNLGFETLGCECCRPSSLDSGNLLPNSIVEVVFNSDGIYFESFSNSWANEFHLKNQFKKERELQMREWNYGKMPSGPFFRGQKAKLLLADAVKLEETGLAEIKSLLRASHFCLMQESFLKKELLSIDIELSRLKGMIEAMEKARASKGILDYSRLFLDPSYSFLINLHSCLSMLACSLPNYIASGGKYFSPELSELLSIKQDMIMRDFRDFCNSKGARAVFKGNSAYAKGKNLLSIAKEFSKSKKTRQPLLRLNL